MLVWKNAISDGIWNMMYWILLCGLLLLIHINSLVRVAVHICDLGFAWNTLVNAHISPYVPKHRESCWHAHGHTASHFWSWTQASLYVNQALIIYDLVPNYICQFISYCIPVYSLMSPYAVHLYTFAFPSPVALLKNVLDSMEACSYLF